MANVKCFSIAGVKLWFWSNDHHPPHFHAKINGEWEVVVRFLEREENMFKMKWQKKIFGSHHRKMLADMAVEHRAELLKEWERIHP
jgi:hypothetical protein